MPKTHFFMSYKGEIMKKKLLIVLIFLQFFTLFAFDFGGSIGDTFKLRFPSIDEIQLKNDFSTSFWFKSPLDYYGHTNFLMDVLFNINSDFSTKKSVINFDVNQLYINMKIPLSNNLYCNYFMGRTNFSDITGYVYNEKLDYLSFYFGLNNFNFSTSFGYSGLLNAKTLNMYYPLTYNTTNKIYAFPNEKFFILDSKLTFNMNNFFDTLAFEGIMFFSPQILTGPRFYVNAAVQNQLTNNITYDINTSFLFNSTSDGKIANLTQANFCFPKENFDLILKALFASHNSNSLTSFSPLTATTVNFFGSPCTDIFQLGGRFYYNLQNKNSFSFDIDAVYQYNEANKKMLFNGIQWVGKVNIYATSDILINLTLAQNFKNLDESQFYLDTGLKIIY